MIKNIKNQYKNTKVQLDNQEYIDCVFEDCTMEYSGTGPVGLSGCSFRNVNWVFSGPAQNTLNFLKAIYNGMGDGGKQLVEKTFENIRKKSV